MKRYILISGSDSDADKCVTTALGSLCKAFQQQGGEQRAEAGRHVALLRLHEWCAQLLPSVLTALDADVNTLWQFGRDHPGACKVQVALDYELPPDKRPIETAAPPVGSGTPPMGGNNPGPPDSEDPADLDTDTATPTFYVALTWTVPIAGAQALIDHLATPGQMVQFVATLSDQLAELRTVYLRPTIAIENLVWAPLLHRKRDLVLGQLDFDSFLDPPDPTTLSEEVEVAHLAALLTQLLDGVLARQVGSLSSELPVSTLRKQAARVHFDWDEAIRLRGQDEVAPSGAPNSVSLWSILENPLPKQFAAFAAALRGAELPILPVAAAAASTGGAAAQQQAPQPDPDTGAANADGELINDFAQQAATRPSADKLLIRVLDSEAETLLVQPLTDGIVLLGDEALRIERFSPLTPAAAGINKLDSIRTALRQRRVYVQCHRSKAIDIPYYTITDFDPPASDRTTLNGQPLSPLFAALLTERSVIKTAGNHRITLALGPRQGEPDTSSWLAVQNPGDALLIELPGKRLVVPPQQTLVQVPLRITNPTNRVERLSVFVDGAPVDWPVASPLTEPLYAKESKHILYTLEVPLPRLAAEHNLLVRLISDNLGAQVAAEPLRLSVPPLLDFDLELQPEQVRAGELAEVYIRNGGNFSRLFLITWRDRRNEVTFQPAQTTVTVAPFSTGVVSYTARPTARSSRLFGREQRHEISVTAAPQSQVDAPPKTTAGQLISPKLIPGCAPVVLLLALAALFVIYTLIRPPAFTRHNLQIDSQDAQVALAGRPLVLDWDGSNDCAWSVARNGAQLQGWALGGGARQYTIANPQVGDKLTVRLLGCTLLRSDEWNVEVVAAPSAPPDLNANRSEQIQAFHLGTANVQTFGPGTGGAITQAGDDAQPMLLAGQTGDLCLRWQLKDAYAKDAYVVRLLTIPKLEAIDQQGLLDTLNGEKCFPIASTFKDINPQADQPSVFNIRIGVIEQATGKLVSESSLTKVVQLFKPACKVNVNEPLFIREGPGRNFAQRGQLQLGDVVYPIGSPVQLLEQNDPSEHWTPVTFENDPRPGWIANQYLSCPLPINVLPPYSQIPPTPTPTPSPTPTATPLPTATPQPPPEPKMAIEPKIINLGECAMVTWSIQNVQAVYLNGEGVAGEAEQQLCPGAPGQYSFTWTIIAKDGKQSQKNLTLRVNDN